MLLPKKEINVFPASLNTGVTQITNGSYRVHINELAIGQAVGRMLSYCLAASISPFDLEGTALRDLQISWIKEGAMLYPISNNETDSLFHIGTQYLIVTGALIPQTVLDPVGHRATTYVINATGPLAAADSAIASKVLEAESNETLTYQILLPAVIGDSLPGTALIDRAKELHLLGPSSMAIPEATLVNRAVNKGDLYRAIGFLVQNNRLP